MKLLVLALAISIATCGNGQLVLKDIFGRSLEGHPIKLVDWEGYMANPAIRLSIQAPATAAFPLHVDISANGPRLYFNMPSSAGAAGPSKTITLTNDLPVTIYLSIFPDRDSSSETYTLILNSTFGQQYFTISVLDQDRPGRDIEYPILPDFSADTVHHFFDDPIKRNIARQAADDWGYYLKNMNFDTVPALNEYTFIWDDYFASGNWSMNKDPYSGFLLYCYGANEVLHRSGGAASFNDFQKINGILTGLRRSGGYNSDPDGNYNSLGWNDTISDNSWYLATNFGDVPNDLYSIALHEMGHAFCFHDAYPVFETYVNQAYISDSTVNAYQQTTVPVDGYDHLSNNATEDSAKLTDRISLKGAFGSEYAAKMPQGRWLITKLSLLVLQAIGYELRPTTAFETPAITTAFLPNASQGTMYSVPVEAHGGIPFYQFQLTAGVLPDGVLLDSFTGMLSGTPTQSGSFNFTLRATDYDNQWFEKNISIKVRPVYTFTGNGDWNNPANWSNNQVPPLPLTTDIEVIINPVAGGQCTFTGVLNVPAGCELKVEGGKVFNIKP